ncbi:MAG: hypothetical protein C4K60_14285 [Ideonella sp. MAG2]|nr:MAG: hypothetical protein C4K60_14285 [Ideonella sp. MAG2]
MRYMVVFDDTPEMAAVRQRLEPEHLAFLERYRSEIPMAGGLRKEPGGAYTGALWVFEVSSRERAVELIQLDPYYQAHARRYRLEFWGKAFPEVSVLM